MRRQRYLRTPSAQTLCIFCTCRLIGDLPPAWSATTRRRLNTGRPTQSSAGAAAAQAPDADNSTPQPSPPQPQWTFDPSSSLTRSEQAERARLRQRRQERELAQQQVLEVQRRQREEATLAIAKEREAQARREREVEAARRRRDEEEREKITRQWREQRDQEEKERVARQWREQQAAEERERVARQWREQQAEEEAKAKAQAAASAARDKLREESRQREERESLARQWRQQQAEEAKAKAQAAAYTERDKLQEEQRPAQEPAPGGGQVAAGVPGHFDTRRSGRPGDDIARSSERSLNFRRMQKSDPALRQTQDQLHAGSRSIRLDESGGNARPAATSSARSSPPRRDDLFAAQTRSSPRPPPRVALPSFGSAAAAPAPARPATDDGWGSGAVQTAPVKYSEAPVERRYEKLLAERSPPVEPPRGANPNILTANGPTTNFHYHQELDRGSRVPQMLPLKARGTESHPRRRQDGGERDPMDVWENLEAEPELPQQSGVHDGQQPGAREQLSGAYGRHPGAHEQQSGVDGRQSGINGQQSTPEIRDPERFVRDARDAREKQPLPARRASQYDFLAALQGGHQDTSRNERLAGRESLQSSDVGARNARQSPQSTRDSTRFETAAEDALPARNTRDPLDLRPRNDASTQQFAPLIDTHKPVPAPFKHDTRPRQQPQPEWQDNVPNRRKLSSGWEDDVQHRRNTSPAWHNDLQQPPPNAPPPAARPPLAPSTSYYQPPPASGLQQSRQNAYADHNSHGYRATMLDAQDYQPAQPSFDETQAAEWQHLRRRNSAPPPSSRPPPPQHSLQPQQQRNSYQDPDWIDRQFREHVQQRPQQVYPAYLDQQQQPGQQQRDPSGPFDLRQAVRQAQGIKCGRCGEMGHVARECTGPDRSTCHRCGQIGHRALNCPYSDSSVPHARRRQSEGIGREEEIARSTGRFGGREQGVRPDPFGGREQGVRSYPFGGREQGMRSDTLRGREQTKQDAFAERDQKRLDRFGAQEESRLAPRGQREDAVDDVRADLFGPKKSAEAEEDEDEAPTERVLRSRKFTEEAKKEKPRAGRRRDDDDEEDEGAAAREDRVARKASRKAQKAEEQAAAKAEKSARKAEQGPPVNLPEFVSVATLAQHLGVRYEQFVGRLERLGYDDVFPGKILNSETSGMIAMEYGYEPIFGEAQAAAEREERDLTARPEIAQEDKEYLPTRPPVVTIMGHVDHGKTTILDYLRKSSVAAGEAGGITQHIGAFSVPLASSGRTITFLDTPGHAAFLAMRQRGANVTDLVILVVAADDSVKPQTLEAIKHAKAASVPMIVAVNKIDKEGADLQRVKQDLARHGVEIEDFGGETQVVPVSGKTGEGMDELEENVVTLSEILDHRAESEGPVEGWVLEATTKKAGRVATVLVRRGTLRPGSVIVAGKTWARVRTLRNEAGQTIADVGPGMPVEVDGWRDQPAAGDEVLQAASEQKATDVVEYRHELEEQKKIAEDMEAINETRRLDQERQRKEKAAAEAAKRARNSDDPEAIPAEKAPATAPEDQPTGQLTVPLIIKADVSGSAEAVSAYILSISSPLVAPQILRSTVGALNESDVELADAARGHIVAFNLPTDEGLKAVAARAGVKVLENNIIYRVLDDVKAVMEERLPALVRQRVLGEADVGVGFEIGVGGRKKLKIAGCKVRNGVVGRGSRVRVMRNGEKVYDGTISSLKNVKKDVQEMRKGTECGMGFEGWEGFEVGDQVQTYEEISEKRKL